MEAPMPASTVFDPARLALDLPKCPNCGAPMWLSRIEPDEQITTAAPSNVCSVISRTPKSSNTLKTKNPKASGCDKSNRRDILDTAH